LPKKNLSLFSDQIWIIEEPRSNLRDVFYRRAVLRIDRKEFDLLLTRSLLRFNGAQISMGNRMRFYR